MDCLSFTITWVFIGLPLGIGLIFLGLACMEPDSGAMGPLMCLFGLFGLLGSLFWVPALSLCGPYEQQATERHAREALMPAGQFLPAAGDSPIELAAPFNVPRPSRSTPASSTSPPRLTDA